MSRVRFSAFVPPLPVSETRRLRGLSARNCQSFEESKFDSVAKRAKGLASLLDACGRRREAGELRRRVSCLERLDEWNRHASDLEIVAGLYRAARGLEPENGHGAEDQALWVQTGTLSAESDLPRHGPAYRQTADLRGRALGWVLSAVARYERELASRARP